MNENRQAILYGAPHASIFWRAVRSITTYTPMNENRQAILYGAPHASIFWRATSGGTAGTIRNIIMMNYGAHGRDLILELKRSQQQNQQPSSSSSRDGECPTLPPYNDRLVRSCLQDLQLHVQALQDQVEANAGQQKPPTAVRPSILLQKAAISRNKRCLLAYHQARLSIISKAYWESSMDVLLMNDDSSTTQLLSPLERTFATEYERLIQKYSTSAGVTDDLRASRHPPQPVDKVQVRVVTQHDPDSEGPIVLESGATVDLVVGTVHYLLYSDVESMLRNGTLELLAAEEDANQHPMSATMSMSNYL